MLIFQHYYKEFVILILQLVGEKDLFSEKNAKITTFVRASFQTPFGVELI